jgi:AsmA protein
VAASGGGGGAVEKPPAFDYAPLRQLVVDGEIAVGELAAHGGKVQNFSMEIKGNNGIFTLDPFRLDLYQGILAVTGTFDVQGDKPKAEVRWQAEKIAVGPLLRETMEKDIIEGTLIAAGNITFSGDDGIAVKKSLNGKGNLNFIDGAVVGIDLAAMARNVTSSFTGGTAQQKPRTDFAELDVPFTLTDGVMQTLNTRLASPFLRLAMSGTADLITEKLNFKVKPTVVATLTGQGDSKSRQGITVPILVTGTFAKPEYSADLSEMVSRKTLEDAAKDPQGTAKKAKALRDTGRQLFKSLKGGN